MNHVYYALSMVCIIFALYFLLVVCVDAERTQKEDIKKGVKYERPVWKIVWRYLKQSFWYHFPKL